MTISFFNAIINTVKNVLYIKGEYYDNGIRINCGDSEKQMAEKLGISASYLSAIENGKRNVPDDLKDAILANYDLTPEEQEKMKKALASSLENMRLDFANLEENRRRVIYAVAKENLDDETIERICQVIKSTENKER